MGISKNELFELELCLSMVQKLNDGEIEVECGENPVDKEHAIQLYIAQALKIVKKDEE